MAAKERREIDRFVARSDDGAYETTIIVYQEIIADTAFGPRHVALPSTADYRTIDDYDVNVKGNDEFEIVNDPLHPAMIVRRVG